MHKCKNQTTSLTAWHLYWRLFICNIRFYTFFIYRNQTSHMKYSVLHKLNNFHKQVWKKKKKEKKRESLYSSQASRSYQHWAFSHNNVWLYFTNCHSGLKLKSHAAIISKKSSVKCILFIRQYRIITEQIQT